MPKLKTSAPQPSRHVGEINRDDPLFLVRPVYSWAAPLWANSEYWRAAVKQQEICLNCRERLVGRILSLDWKIDPRDSTQRDELKDEIKYYTKFLTDTGDYSYSELIEWLGADYLDLPFGAAAELGRMGNDPEGRVVWIEPLDGATLFPTLNVDWPVGQYVPQGGQTPVYFPRHTINRIYMSPLPEIKRKGWGMAPPEKIFMALNMISRGDLYYANLLLDTPEAGILDLIDMSKDSAEQWVDAWRKMLAGIDPYKIPVLYEHTQQAQWIPFTRPPQELMFTDALWHYISIVTSGYGLTPGDIGLSNVGGRTLAGAIRDERKTSRNGDARTKRKFVEFFNKLLPSTLKFSFIDLDDEMSVARGRARLADATAMGSWINSGMFTADEARQQTIADGTITISVPEEMPKELKDRNEQKFQNQFTPERPSMLGRPVSPSSGGWGEAAARSQFKSWLDKVRDTDDIYLQRLIYLAYPSVLAQMMGVITGLDDENLIYDWILTQNEALLSGDAGESHHPDQIDLSLVEILKPSVKLPHIEFKWEHDGSLLLDVAKSLADEWSKRSFIETGKEFDVSRLDMVSQDNYTELSDYYDKVRGVLPEIVSKSVIIAVRDYFAETRETDQIIASRDPMCLAYVRSALGGAIDGLFDGYKDRISDIIVKELEKAFNNG